MMKFEIWECRDHGERVIGMMITSGESAKFQNECKDAGTWSCLSKFQAETLDKANARYNELMGFEPYVPMQDVSE